MSNIDKPKHYSQGKIQPIDAIEDWKLGFNDGNVVKYIARAKHKDNELEDLKKAAWYLNRRISECGGANPAVEDCKLCREVASFEIKLSDRDADIDSLKVTPANEISDVNALKEINLNLADELKKLSKEFDTLTQKNKVYVEEEDKLIAEINDYRAKIIANTFEIESLDYKLERLKSTYRVSLHARQIERITELGSALQDIVDAYQSGHQEVLSRIQFAVNSAVKVLRK